MFILGIFLGGFAALMLAISLAEIIMEHGNQGFRYITMNPSMNNGLIEMVSNSMSTLGKLFPSGYVGSIQVFLETNGRPYGLSAQQYLGFRLLLTLTIGGSTFLLVGRDPLLVLTGLALGWIYPMMAVKGYHNNKRERIKQDFPYAVDILAICINAGLGFDMSLRRMAAILPNGSFKEEISFVLREMEMGKSRREALKSLSLRIRLPELSSFINNICQAEELGTGISTILPGMADQIRVKSFLTAETAAAKVPVKMLFPLVCFIFPCILILLMAPLYLSGALNL